MQYIVTSQDRPKKSPLYSMSTGLHYFIMFNDETLTKQITLMGSLAETKEEEYSTEVSNQFPVFENLSKPSTVLELQIINPLNLNLDSQENDPQPDEKIEESNHTKDIHQTDKIKMILSGLCILMGHALEQTLVQVSGLLTLKASTQNVFLSN